VGYKNICNVLGKYLFYFSFILFIPLIVAVHYEYFSDAPHPQRHSTVYFLSTIGITLGLSFIFSQIGKKTTRSILRRESILLVAIIWLMTSLISALPFYLSKTLENPIDAYFEAMSGLTTTGATMMVPKNYDQKGNEIPINYTNIHVPLEQYSAYGTITPIKDPKTNKVIATGIESVGKAILFWRSFIQWLGGMGIVVLFLTVLPALTVGGKFLYHMETPGPIKESLTPRIKDTASILWKLYLGFTIAQVFLLIWTNKSMPFLDAVCIAFSTISTGGFSLKANSIGGYHNFHTEWIVTLFMIIGSLNFSLYFHFLRGKIFKIYEPDFFVYLAFIILGSLGITFSLVGKEQFLLDGTQSIYTLRSAFREGTFQAISAQTSTGFATVNYDLWPFFPQIILLCLMYVGGMAGSTAGGIKTSRFYILFKILAHKIEAIFKPEKVKKIKIGDREITNATSTTVLAFFCIILLISVASIIIFVFNGIDPESALGIVACCINNIGMAFRAAGPDGSFIFLTPFLKLFSCFLMVLGRLEFFTILILFLPSFWKKA